MEVISYHNWSDFVYIDSWGFVVWDFKKTNWRYCIVELTFTFGECNKASDNIWTFPGVPVPDIYIGKKQWHGLPVHRFYHAAFAQKRWNGTEMALGLRYGECRFLPNANCGEKNFESGAKQEGRSGFRKQDIFFGLNCERTDNLSHDMTKPTKWVHPAKTQVSLGIRPVWSESSLSVWRKFGSIATHWAHSQDSDQTGRMPMLIWVFAGRTLILLVLSFCGSNLWNERLRLSEIFLIKTTKVLSKFVIFFVL